jgi:CBS domain-containing protein
LFLLSQARASYRQLAARHALSGFNVGSALSRNFDPVRPEISLASFLSDHVLVSHRQSYPVLSDGRLLGVISLPDLKRFPREEWHERMVSEAMTPQERLVAALPSDDLMGAAERMAEEDLDQLPVVEDGRFIGFVTRSEIVQLIRLGDDLGGSPIQRREARAEKVGPRA